MAYRCNKIFDFYTTSLGSKIGYTYVEKEFDACDIIAAYFCMPVLANLKTKRPIIYFTDATYPAMVDYYFYNRWKFNNIQGAKLEQRAMQKATSIVISSDWAATSAQKDLKILKAKIHIVEYVANISDNDITYRTRDISIDNHLQLLFLGVDWRRKGGEIALNATEFINRNGVRQHFISLG